MRVATRALLFATTFSGAFAQTLKLANNYTGSTFFDRWTFYNGIDANTTGNVLYQTREQAQQEQLTFVNGAGNVIIKVDNSTNGANDPTFGRPSIKILSNDTITAGSLVILDAVHMPFGCAVWPAFWMQGANWPDDGEVDIVENVNLAANNRYALHTLNGCTHPPAGGVQETGQLIATDCFNATNGDEGCLVQETAQNSYGQGFAQNGGGVFAFLWNDDGMKIWFFPRGKVPSDVPTSNPNPSGWGTPSAFFPQSSCDTTKFFGPQTLIFDTTLCGNFAGSPTVFNPSCNGTCTDLIANPANFNDAFFEVRYVAVFSNSSTSSSSSSAGGSNPTSSSGNGTGGGIALTSPSALLSILAGVVVPATFLAVKTLL